MSKTMTTKDKLLLHGRRQFWTNGYSNVSLRQIATAAGVDVALISRHFGGKLGLFEATLIGAFDIIKTAPSSESELVDAFVSLFADTPRTNTEPSAIRMLLTNAHDDDVGDLVLELYDAKIQQGLCELLGERRAALFAAVVFGFSVAEKSMRISGIAAPESDAYRRQFKHLIQSALDFQDTV